MADIIELPFWVTENLLIGAVQVPFSVLQLITMVLLPGVLVSLGLFLLFILIRRGINDLPIQKQNAERAVRWAHRGIRLVWFTAIVLLLSRILGAELARWFALGIRAINQPLLTAGNTSISLVTIFLVIPVFYFAGWLSRTTRVVLERGFVRRLNLDPAREFSLLSILKFSVMGLTIIVGLSIIGINLSSLTVIFGVLGIGLGFGLQEVVGNTFAGLVIIFTSPIKEGDRILVGDIEGTVQQIKIINTIVNTVTNETLIIPNSRITNNLMHNYSYDDLSILICSNVQVSYASDLDRVGEVLMEVGRRNPWRVEAEEPRYRVVSFDDSGISVRLCTWITDARERISATSWTNLEIWRAFRDNHVKIPFPQLDLHLKSGAPDAAIRRAAGQLPPGAPEEAPPGGGSAPEPKQG